AGRHGGGDRRAAGPRAGRRVRRAAQVLDVRRYAASASAAGNSGTLTGRMLRSTTLSGASSPAGAMPCSLNLRALGRTRVSSEPTVSLYERTAVSRPRPTLAKCSVIVASLE